MARPVSTRQVFFFRTSTSSICTVTAILKSQFYTHLRGTNKETEKQTHPFFDIDNYSSTYTYIYIYGLEWATIRIPIKNQSIYVYIIYIISCSNMRMWVFWTMFLLFADIFCWWRWWKQHTATTRPFFFWNGNQGEEIHIKYSCQVIQYLDLLEMLGKKSNILSKPRFNGDFPWWNVTNYLKQIQIFSEGKTSCVFKCCFLHWWNTPN